MELLEDFESLSIGELNGQNGWSGPGGFSVVSSPVYEGSKGGYLNASATYYTKAFPFLSTGSVTFYFRASQTGCRRGLQLYSGSRRITDVIFYDSTNIKILGSGGFTTFASYSVNVWAKIEIEWNGTHIRARKDDGTWSAWFLPYETGDSIPTNIQIAAYGGSYAAWIDLISGDIESVVPPVTGANFFLFFR